MKITLTLLIVLLTSKSPEQIKFINPPVSENVSKVEQKTNEIKDLQLNLENLYKRILKSGIEFPDVAFAQAVLESGYFKSKLTKTNSNLFGMRLPKKRPTTATGEIRGFSVYESWHDSVEDYKLYQERLLRKGSISKSEYLEKLNRVYAYNPRYSKEISYIIKKHSDIIGNIPSEMLDGKIEEK